MARITVESKQGYLQKITAGGHTLYSDLPLDEDGADSAPEPYHLLLAALGACTSMTILMYARRKQWPVEDIRVELEHERVDASECEDCATKQGSVDRIHKRIYVTGSLSAEQLERIRYIAGRCPVNLTLQREINMVDSVSILAPEASARD